MRHLAPAIFREFTCAAQTCLDSCCRAGWEIVIDPETLSRYEGLPGPEGDRIRAAVIPGTEALLRQDTDRVCVLLDPDGLCSVQKRFGHESLCRVCREYPRFHREFGNLTEHGVSLSCPKAFTLAVLRPLAWDEWEDDAPVVPNDLDPERYLPLREGRAAALRLLEEKDRPFEERLVLVWDLAERLQRELDGGKRAGKTACARLRDPIGRKAVLRRYFRPGGRVSSEWVRAWDVRRWISVFSGLEILSPEWREGLETLRERLSEADGQTRKSQEEGPLLQEYPGTSVILRGDRPRERIRPLAVRLFRLLPPAADSLSFLHKRYARYLWYSLYKYWLDAVDDGRLLARVRRSFAMTLLGLEMDALVPRGESWLRRISREVEHCEENLEALLR